MIEARALTKVYGGKAAVDGIDFQVKPGVVTGFLGPNGAGKSTTMRMILGLDLPTSGTVTVNGRCYQGMVWPLHEVGALLDARAVHPGRSAYNHLHSLAAANGIGRARVGEVLELVGLASVARKRAGGFSLGMAQRLGIAGALLLVVPVIVEGIPHDAAWRNSVPYLPSNLGNAVWFANSGGLVSPRRQLAYKCGWYGSLLVVAGRWFPSSKACHACGHVQDIGWAEHWTCGQCGATHQRDDNAAVNLARYEDASPADGSAVGPVRAAVKRRAE